VLYEPVRCGRQRRGGEQDSDLSQLGSQGAAFRAPRQVRRDRAARSARDEAGAVLSKAIGV
jgi:hypothetical protein